MIFHPIVLFLICWQCVNGHEVENISIESVLDQVAIPTKIIEDFLQKPAKNRLTRKFPVNEPTESSTVHYENSNGFIPLIASTQSYEFNKKKRNLTKVSDNSKNIINKRTRTRKSNDVEENPIFSPEARIFLNLPVPSENRRSFHIDTSQDDFELLKVSNGTPAVADYNSFYEQSKGHSNTYVSHHDSNSKSIRNKDREREKPIQNYLGNYEANNGDRKYAFGEATEHETKNFHQQENIQDKNYNFDDTRTFSQKPLSSKTNHVSNTTPKINTKSSNTNEDYKFKSPIMVQPSEYKVDLRFNDQSVQSFISTSNSHNDVINQMDSTNLANRTPEQFSSTEGTNRNYESANSQDFSEEDYMDEIEKSRRVQKTSRRRPHYDSSRKLPKEHRETYDDSYDDHGRKRPNPRLKSKHRQKQKPISMMNEDELYDIEGDHVSENTNDYNNQQNEGNTWSQITPNLEVSHSNGYEINQIEKPKFQIVPVNILSNFDHATALDNSQGFDITNAMFTGFVHEGPLLSTATPLISSSPNYIGQNLISSSTPKPQVGIASPVPDIIVGQNSFQNPVQAVLVPNKLQQNMLNQYVQSTVAPAVFAVTPRPSFTASSTITPNLQQILKQVQASLPINQQLSAQPTRSTFTNLLQPMQSSANNQIYVNSNSNGLQGQNLYQLHNIQSTTSRSVPERIELQNKKTFSGNNGQYYASASLAVGQGSQRQSNKDNNNLKSNNINNINGNNNYNILNNHQPTRQNLNAYVQPTLVPAILHTGIGLINNQNQQLVRNPFFLTNAQQNSQILKATNNAFDNSMKQLQYDVQNRYQLTGISGIDNIGGSSNNVNAINNLLSPIQKAHLPILGAKNVEIINPNLNANAYAINQIPATLVTTPIPILTTTGFIASKPIFSAPAQESTVSMQNFLNSFTKISFKKPSIDKQLNNYSFIKLQGSDKAVYNPINFVPNYDLLKSQSILNSNVVPNNLFSQQNLNLVPIVPGGNFFKHSQGAQVDLLNKPKLNSDLEKYAEEMFKESLRTIYNSHKWNNDPRLPSNVSLTDNSDLAKLKNELLRLKNNIRESKIPKDILEAHHTENQIRTVKPGSDYKRPDSSIEQPHKNDHKTHSGPHHHSHHHHHRHKPGINDFLTPPRVNSFISKSPFHDKPPKKRPGHGPRPNFNNDRPRPRHGIASSKPKGVDAQASSIVDYRYHPRPHQEKSRYNHPRFQGLESYNYPTFTTSSSDNDRFKASVEYRSSEGELFDINHQRTHNLMGLLMKNKQLPPGVQDNSFNNKEAIGRFFDEENRRTQSQAYKEVFRNFQKKSDRSVPPIPLNRVSRRNYSTAYRNV